MARRSSRRHRSSTLGGMAWLAGMAVLTIGIVVGVVYMRETRRTMMTDATTGCLTARDTPQATLFLVDATDRLTPENAKHVVDTIVEDEGQLADFSRLIIVPFGDDTAAPLTPVFSRCLPGRHARLDQNRHAVDAAGQEFQTALGKLKDTLVGLAPSRSSPIADQIVRAASDPVLEWRGVRRTLVVVTDGLESSIYWSRDLQLPDPPANLLKGVDVEYVELGNGKARQLQSDQMRRQWRAWLEKAGATVRMTAPGYAAT